MFYTFEGSLKRAQAQFQTMRSVAAQMETELFVPRPEVSGWSAGEHLDHLSKVSGGILHLLVKGEPIEQAGITPLGRVILFAGWIPRGKAKSPERLRGAVATPGELADLIAKSAAVAEQLAAAPTAERRRPIVRHPIFGGLNAAQAVRFVEVHACHHFKIVRDIARAGGRDLTLP